QPRRYGSPVWPHRKKISVGPGQPLRKAVFGGIAFEQFGHFLLETTARLWCSPLYRDLPWLFLTHRPIRLAQYQEDLLLRLGLRRDQICIVNRWQPVEELIIPELAFTYDDYATHEFRDMFRRVAVTPRHYSRQRIFLWRGD